MKKLMMVILAAAVFSGSPAIRPAAAQSDSEAALQRLLEQAARSQAEAEQQMRALRERQSDEAVRNRAMMDELIAQARTSEAQARARVEEQARASRAEVEELMAMLEAQDRAVRAKPGSEPARPVVPDTAQLVNVRIDVTVVVPGPKPARKTVSVTVADGGSGSVRSFQPFPVNFVQSEVATPSQNLNMINVDARPRLVRDGRVHTAIVIEYRGGSLSFDPLLESGKPLTVAQVPDPTSDVVTTLEVTATVLK
jgi:Skp family chaperone for outer membrane proteins